MVQELYLIGVLVWHVPRLLGKALARCLLARKRRQGAEERREVGTIGGGGNALVVAPDGGTTNAVVSFARPDCG